MNKQFATMATLLFAASALAGGNHFHPKKVAKCAKECTADEAKASVPEAITYLNKWGKIETSWSSAKIESVEKKQFSKGPEWVVTLADASKQKRYVFVSLDGYVTGSNSTGE